MADELALAGLHIDSLEDRIEAVSGLLRAAIAPNLDTSPETPTGQLVRILAERTQSVLELLRAVHAGMDPDEATGDALDALCRITGTYRRPASSGLVVLTVNLDAATLLAAGAIAQVAGEPDNRWVTVADVTSVGAGDYTVVAEAEGTGEVHAVAGTITVIATPSLGWNSVTNAADAVPGAPAETDTALRARRELELAIGGSTTVDAIRAELVALDGMIEARVVENDLDITVGGIPPHAVESIVWDGAIPAVADADITEAIWTSKAAGIRAWGTTVSDHEDEQGVSHEVRFTRAAPLRLLLEVSADVDATQYPGDAAASAALAARALAHFRVGGDVYRSRVVDWAMDIAGVEDAYLVRMAIWPAALVNTDGLPVNVRQIATLAAVDVTWIV